MRWFIPLLGGKGEIYSRDILAARHLGKIPTQRSVGTNQIGDIITFVDPVQNIEHPVFACRAWQSTAYSLVGLLNRASFVRIEHQNNKICQPGQFSDNTKIVVAAILFSN